MPRHAHLLSRLRSGLIFAPAMALATALYGTASMACSRFDATGARQHRIARAWARMLCRIGGIRVRVEGLENLILESRSVMVCNHISYMDVPVLFGYLPLQFRILAKAGLFKIPFMGSHLRRCQHLPVDQSNARSSLHSLHEAAAAVAEGLPLFVFPEAGRSFSGAMQDFVPGAFYVAIQAQVPIVPMVLIGTWEVLQPATAHLRPGRVDLVICPPVATTGYSRRDAVRLAGAVHDQMQAIYRTRRPQVVGDTSEPLPVSR